MSKYIILGKKKVAISYNINQLEQIINIDSSYNVGDIYLGTVINVLNNLNIAFVKLDEWKQNGFMVLKNNFSSTFSNQLNLGEEIIVQITKKQISKKGPTVTENISIENEYFKLYLCKNKGLSVKQASSFNNKKYLGTIGTLIQPKDSGLEIKKKINENFFWDFIYSLKELNKKSSVIKEKIRKTTKKNCLIKGRQKLTDTILKKKLIQADTILIVKSKTQAIQLREELSYNKRKKGKLYIEYCNERISKKFQVYIEHLIAKTLQSDVKIKTGGYIVIEKTEALTSIDVNSGSFNKFKSSRKTALWINLTATKEIIYQLQIRNISGIIVIDFIDMVNQNDQLSLLEYLNNQLQSSLNGSQIIQISEIGLVEIIRQRQEKNIYDMFAQQCTECNGKGYLRQGEILNDFSTYFLEMSSIYR